METTGIIGVIVGLYGGGWLRGAEFAIGRSGAVFRQSKSRSDTQGLSA